METVDKILTSERNNSLKEFAKSWVAGKWISSDNLLQSINPSTGETIGEYAQANIENAKEAITTAQKAFRETTWRQDHHLRSKALLNVALEFEAKKQELIRMLSLEGGKILPEATVEVESAIALLHYWAGKTFIAGRSGAPETSGLSLLVREPLGVAGIIVPFNAPVALSIRSIAPALAAGNTVVVKIPGVCAQTGFLLSRIFASCHLLPKGILNILTETVNDVSKHLVESKQVNVISFTGSTHTGREIAAECAKNLKRINLELGGKTPLLVFNDANIEEVLPILSKAITFFSGQFCMTGSRILLQRDIAERCISALSENIKKLKIGLATDNTSEMGPMINKANVERVDQLVEEAIKAGAKAIVRGGPFLYDKYANGSYYSPTILQVEDPNLPIVQKEIFGPVATVHVFDNESEAIDLANNSSYGLAAAIFTKDFAKALAISKTLQSGTVWINTYFKIFPEFEEGGFKQSGLGRLNGEYGLDAFLEYKHIIINHS